jgi:hypothetical protein
MNYIAPGSIVQNLLMKKTQEIKQDTHKTTPWSTITIGLLRHRPQLRTKPRNWWTLKSGRPPPTITGAQLQTLEPPQESTPRALHGVPSPMNTHQPLPLRRWKRNQQSDAAIPDHITDDEPEPPATKEPPGRGRRAASTAKGRKQTNLPHPASTTQDSPS